MLPEEELKRTARQMTLIGPEAQQLLHDAHVLVIGAGGLGCPVMQTLAATGIGHITVWDDDTVALSNIHRQILFGADDVGRKKVDVAAERLRALQPGIEVTTVDGRLDEDNFVEALRGIDILIDGSDTFATKFLAADAAEVTGTPLVWGSVLRTRGDIAVWWTGPGAPEDGVGLRDLYPAQPDPNSVPDCATAGVLGVTTSVVGSLMATEVVKFILGRAEIGRLHMYDAFGATLRHFTVRRDPGRELVTSLGTYAACAASGSGGASSSDAEAQQLLDAIANARAHAIDVREVHERAIQDLPYPSTHLPLSTTTDADVEQALADAGTRDVVVYCASGVRSQGFVDKHAALAEEYGVTLHSLPGGANAWGITKA